MTLSIVADTSTDTQVAPVGTSTITLTTPFVNIDLVKISFSAANTLGMSLGSVSAEKYTQPPVTIAPATLPNPQVGKPYSQSITPGGGMGAPFAFAVTAGTLPMGLSLNATTGIITGTPTAAGPAAFTIRVADGGANFASQAYSVTTIAAPAPASIPTLSEWGLIFMSSILAMFGITRIRRRQR